MSEPYPIDAAILAKQINEHARAMDADGLLLGKNLLKVAQHIDELIPEGSILVDRARFERLREYVESVATLEGVEPRSAVDHPAWYRWRDARRALQPSDLDPLP